MQLISFLTSVIGIRDPHGEHHSNHVMRLSSMLAAPLGMSSAQLDVLTFAARIHDIGKIAINDFVINKPGRFTEAEYLMVQHHAQLGAKLIETLEVDSLLPPIIRHHHENFDGSGYPHQIKGEQIPLEARIIRITDTYDALTSNRGYRPAYTSKKAQAIMEKEERFFDPTLLEIFFRALHNGRHGSK